MLQNQDILKKLYNYTSDQTGQMVFKNKLISFIQGNPHCFESVHPPKKGQESNDEIGHITGSAWVLSPDKQSVLLTHHKKLNKWLQLGGHSDGEPNVLMTALREAKEESGIEEIKPFTEEIFDLDVHIFPQKKNIAAHLHYDIRFCFIAEHLNFNVSEESHDLKWVRLLEITKDQFEPSIYRMAQKSKKI